MSDKKSETIKTIVDHIGRTVVGIVTKEDTKTITLNNPVIVHVQPDPQTGQLQVQSFPYLFMEFIKGDKDKNNWTFYKTAIATSDVTLDDRIITQYKNINSPQAAADQQPPASSDGDVIKLFDDE
tara:strand:+ start:585 stop:959 length:375 start_codon:yes stop_codon:yes gene_type:complete